MSDLEDRDGPLSLDDFAAQIKAAIVNAGLARPVDVDYDQASQTLRIARGIGVAGTADLLAAAVPSARVPDRGADRQTGRVPGAPVAVRVVLSGSRSAVGRLPEVT
ncbi:MAG: hypothetical protein JOZ81_15515 [Chloroflexi bacterium]|nr:hypothetical protein [Chloroflexota bacterium]